VPPTGSPYAPGAQPQHAYTPQPAQVQPPQQYPYSPPASPPKAPPKKKKPLTSGKTFLIAFAGAALACVLALAGFGIYQSINSSSLSGVTIIGAETSSDIIAEEEDMSLAEAVAAKALPSVVNINVYTAQTGGFGSQGDSSTLIATSLGSGVVLSKDGYIVTNYHVIEGADKLVVTIGDEEYEAEITGYDSSSDLAVIKALDATNLTPIGIGNSSDLVSGQWVMTIGSPFGLDQSVATGIVSATSRSEVMVSETDGTTTAYTNLIQTDAAINPGNSGGALVDSDGNLIGINTLITSYSGNYSGVGFAIPSDYAISIASQIIAGETPTHAQLGVSLTTVTSSVANRYGLAVDSGAYVTEVQSQSGAELAGVKTGDIITKIENTKVTSASDLMLAVRSHNPGDKVQLEVNRDGQTLTLEVTLGSDATNAATSSQNSYSTTSYTDCYLSNAA
jgi:putative serine protease PepD